MAVDPSRPAFLPVDPAQRFERLLAHAHPLDMGDLAAVKNALTSQRFADALAAFESSPLPSDYSDKQTQKDAMIKAFRDAIEAAKSGSQDDMKAKTDAALKSITALRA